MLLEAIFDQLGPLHKEYLKRDCSEFIASSRTPLYRGSTNRSTTSPIQDKSIRKDRRPDTSTAFETTMFNLLFEKYHFIPNIRYRSVFITTDFHEAKRYGGVSYVFPKNGSELVYNTRNIKDSVTLTVGLGQLFFTGRPEVDDPWHKSRMAIETAYKNDELEDMRALKSGQTFRGWETFNQTLLQYANKVRSVQSSIEYIEDYEVVTTREAGRIKEEHGEIMLTGHDKYVVVDIDATGGMGYYDEFLETLK